jgi:hypothetical protein
MKGGGRPGGTVPPGVGPFGVASANPYVYTPTPLIHPRKWGRKDGGGLRVSAVGTSSPQKLLEASTALWSDLSAPFFVKCYFSRRQLRLDCVTHKFTCKFTRNLQTLSVESRDSLRRFCWRPLAWNWTALQPSDPHRLSSTVIVTLVAHTSNHVGK